MPEPVEAFARESAQRPSFDWVNEMYSRHRGESAERV
jgi:hypothetical protein